MTMRVILRFLRSSLDSRFSLSKNHVSRRFGGVMSAGQRVFLVDGQVVYLEGDGDITEDVLQQALAQLAAGGAQTVEQAEPEPGPEPEPELEEQAPDTQVEGIVLYTEDAGDEKEGVLAILQDKTGQQQTVRLTLDQAATLGIDYEQLLAAGGEESDSAAAAPVPAEQTSAEEVTSLATSVVLDLNESQPSLVNQSEGGDKSAIDHHGLAMDHHLKQAIQEVGPINSAPNRQSFWVMVLPACKGLVVALSGHETIEEHPG